MAPKSKLFATTGATRARRALNPFSSPSSRFALRTLCNSSSIVLTEVAFAGAAILYDTSNVIHHYPSDRYVGAALQLFASVAMMFWYVLRLFMSRD